MGRPRAQETVTRNGNHSYVGQPNARHQRDCVAAIIVNGYHRVPLAIILIADGSRQLAGESDDVLARIKMIDRDCADQTWRRLFKHKGILTLADRYRVAVSNMMVS